MNSSDQITVDKAALRVLAAVADHFTATSPTEALEQHALLIAFGAAAYELTDRSTSGGADKLASAALALVPQPYEGMTRGEYALAPRQILTAAGHEWTEDDNAKVIPSIPGPRTEPAPVDWPRIPAQPKDGER